MTNFYQALSQFFLIFEQTSTLESVNKTFAGVMRIIFQLSFRPNYSSTFVVGREGRVWGRDFRESINYWNISMMFPWWKIILKYSHASHSHTVYCLVYIKAWHTNTVKAYLEKMEGFTNLIIIILMNIDRIFIQYNTSTSPNGSVYLFRHKLPSITVSDVFFILLLLSDLKAGPLISNGG